MVKKDRLSICSCCEKECILLWAGYLCMVFTCYLKLEVDFD